MTSGASEARDRIEVPVDHPERRWLEWLLLEVEGMPGLAPQARYVRLVPGMPLNVLVQFWTDKRRGLQGGFMMPLEVLSNAYSARGIIHQQVRSIYEGNVNA